MLVCSATAGGVPFTLGYIGCPFISVLAPYTFARADDPGWTTLATIEDYPRWAESAFGLFARLLARLPPEERRWPCAPAATCRLLIGRSGTHSREIERLTVTLKPPHLRVQAHDEAHEYQATAPMRPSYDGLVDVFVHGARIAVWGMDEEPPLPPPLTSVPTHRTSEGLAYVLEEELPAHPRRHFCTRQVGARDKRLPAGAHSVADWLRFVGV